MTVKFSLSWAIRTSKCFTPFSLNSRMSWPECVTPLLSILLEQASEQLDVMPPSFRMIWSLVSNEEPRLKEKLPDMPEQSNCQLHYKRNGEGKELKPALFAQTFQHRNSPRGPNSVNWSRCSLRSYQLVFPTRPCDRPLVLH